jgi:hypothetical protein
VGNAQHSYAHFIEACVAEGNGAVIIEEQFIDGFAFFQTGESAVLPEDRGYVGKKAKPSKNCSSIITAPFPSATQASMKCA